MTRCAVILSLLTCFAAHGDSGMVRLQQQAGPWIITLMTDPTPLRVGPVDLSVLVQRDDGTAVLDADITLHLSNADLNLAVDMTRAQADNRLLYAAKFTVPVKGGWTVDLSVEHDDRKADLSTDITVLPAAPRLASLWPWFLPVPLGLGFYGLNQSLRHRR